MCLFEVESSAESGREMYETDIILRSFYQTQLLPELRLWKSRVRIENFIVKVRELLISTVEMQ